MIAINGLESSIEIINGENILLNVGARRVKAENWAMENQELVDDWLNRHGALLIRGLDVNSSRQFGRVLSTLFNDELLPYGYRSTPRTELRGNVYTATEYHQDQLIVQHNEMAYSNSWPLRIGFFCLSPAEVGGETPISRSADVLRAIPDMIRKKFLQKGILYVRNYSNLDLPWQEVFCTQNQEEVSDYCERNDIKYDWHGENQLTTKQKLPAICRHPVCDDDLWFNQAHLFHASTLGEELLSVLESSLGKNNVPRNSYYGDGEEISAETIATILEVYQKSKFSFAWRTGDILLLDNMHYAHGREAFSGNRKVLTGMARPYFLPSQKNGRVL